MSYTSSNNHLLNTLLVKFLAAALGERDWVVRLPALLFGFATVPVMYWLGRQMLTRWASLGAAFLLATSYHHVFFSQNARGYSAYLFFSLLATTLYVKALRDDGLAVWALYVVTIVLDLASHLIAGFVLVGHALVGVVAVWLVRHRGDPWLPLARRLGVVLGLAGLLTLGLYAAALPQMYAYMKTVYAADPAAGFRLSSLELLGEMARGLSAGLGPWALLLGLALAPLVGLGLAISFAGNWALISALALPGLLQAIFFALRQLVFSPRLFLLALPLTILVATQGIFAASASVARILRRRPAFGLRLGAVVVVLVGVASLGQLLSYYAVPKQDFRGALRFVEDSRQAGEMVIVIHLAEQGIRHYAARLGVRDRGSYFFVRSVPALDAVLQAHPGRPSLLVTTFPRALRLTDPGLHARVAKDWVVIRTFPGSVGDGAVAVWRARDGSSRS